MKYFLKLHIERTREYIEMSVDMIRTSCPIICCALLILSAFLSVFFVRFFAFTTAIMLIKEGF